MQRRRGRRQAATSSDPPGAPTCAVERDAQIPIAEAAVDVRGRYKGDSVRREAKADTVGCDVELRRCDGDGAQADRCAQVRRSVFARFA